MAVFSRITRSVSSSTASSFAWLAIGVLWIGLRTFYWNGYYTEDAPGYVSDAIWAALGEYHARDHVNGLNVGTYLPVAIPIWLFGKSEIALSLWPLLCSLLGVASLAGATTIVFGRGFGLLAAFLYVTYPGDVFFSTVVMPDAIQAGWLSFTLLLIVVACAGSVARRPRRLVAAGVALGVCHLVRANDVMLVPVALGAVAILCRLWKRETAVAAVRGCLLVLSGWMLVLVVEGAAYLWAAHDFLLRFRVVNRHYGTVGSIAQWGLNTDPSTIPFSIFPPVTWWRTGDWGHLYPDQAYHGLIFCLALAALVTGAAILTLQRSRIPDRGIAGLALAALWVCWPLLYHQFGTQSLSQFVPMHRLSRHLVVYAPGAIFATVAGCFLIEHAMTVWQFANGRRIVIAIGLALLAAQLHFNWTGEQVVHGAYQQIKGTYARIRDHLPAGVRRIVADPGDLCFFDFWLNPLGVEQVKIVPFANYSRCDELKTGVVLTHSNPGWEGSGAPVIQETVARLPCLVRPPADWRLVYDGYPERVYQITAER